MKMNLYMNRSQSWMILTILLLSGFSIGTLPVAAQVTPGLRQVACERDEIPGTGEFVGSQPEAVAISEKNGWIAGSMTTRRNERRVLSRSFTVFRRQVPTGKPAGDIEIVLKQGDTNIPGCSDGATFSGGARDLSVSDDGTTAFQGVLDLGNNQGATAFFAGTPGNVRCFVSDAEPDISAVSSLQMNRHGRLAYMTQNSEGWHIHLRPNANLGSDNIVLSQGDSVPAGEGAKIDDFAAPFIILNDDGDLAISWSIKREEENSRHRAFWILPSGGTLQLIGVADQPLAVSSIGEARVSGFSQGWTSFANDGWGVFPGVADGEGAFFVRDRDGTNHLLYRIGQATPIIEGATLGSIGNPLNVAVSSTGRVIVRISLQGDVSPDNDVVLLGWDFNRRDEGLLPLVREGGNVDGNPIAELEQFVQISPNGQVAFDAKTGPVNSTRAVFLADRELNGPSSLIAEPDMVLDSGTVIGQVAIRRNAGATWKGKRINSAGQLLLFARPDQSQSECAIVYDPKTPPVGETPKGEISGRLVRDINRDGKINESWAYTTAFLQLFNADQQGKPQQELLRTAEVSPDGKYSFENVEVGDYVIQAVIEDDQIEEGHTFAIPTEGSPLKAGQFLVTVSENMTETRDFLIDGPPLIFVSTIKESDVFQVCIEIIVPNNLAGTGALLQSSPDLEIWNTMYDVSTDPGFTSPLVSNRTPEGEAATRVKILVTEPVDGRTRSNYYRIATVHVGEVPEGAVAYYPFSGNARDAIGTNHGTVNGALLRKDRFGFPNSAYWFDGEDDDITLSNVLPIGTGDSTVAAWVSIPEPGTEGLGNFERVGTVLGNNIGTPTTIWGFHDNGQMWVYWNTAVPDVYAPENTDLRVNQWFHVAWVRDNTEFKEFRFYINGDFIHRSAPNEGAGGDITFTEVHWIGGNNIKRSNFHGLIDQVVIYDRALTADEIGQLARQ